MTLVTVFMIVTVAPVALTVSFWIWQHIRSCLIPTRKIDAMTDLMLATFGPFAEHEAFIRQREAWYRGDGLAQGVWRLIRVRLRRRWYRGEVALYDGHEVAALRHAASTVRQADPSAPGTVPPPVRRRGV